jgi:hypothetical protein
VPPGAFVEMKALMDLICVVSSCPFDLNIEGWTINAGRTRGGGLLIRARAAQPGFHRYGILAAIGPHAIALFSYLSTDQMFE